MKENKNTVNKHAGCSRCANNGGKFCDKCNGINHWKMLLAAPVEFDESRKRQKEYQREYYQKNKKKIQEKRRAYFLKYYHEVLKKDPDATVRRRARSLKYYYAHHDEIRAKRNAKKRADWQDPKKLPQLRKAHAEYMRDYRNKKKECSTLNEKEVIMACGSKKSGGKKPPKK